MDPQYFELFLTLVEERNLSAAARALHFSRPVVAERLSQMERQLGVQLFVREVGGRALVLTPAGRAFLPIARQHRELQESINGTVSRFIREQGTPGFRLGVSKSAFETIAPGVARRMLRSAPELHLQVKAINYNNVTAAVESCSFDAAIVFNSAPILPKSPFYRAVPFYREERCLICPADTPLPERVLSAKELDPDFEVVYPGSEVTDGWRKKNFPAGTRPYCVVESHASVHRFLVDRRCWAVLPVSLARTLVQEHDDLTMRQVKPALPTRPCSLLLSTAEPVRENVELFLSCCDQFLKENPWLRSVSPK